jgi:hypothetical protein
LIFNGSDDGFRCFLASHWRSISHGHTPFGDFDFVADGVPPESLVLPCVWCLRPVWEARFLCVHLLDLVAA